MANGHGGARPGSGRKRISERYAPQVESFHDQVAADLDKRYAALAFLADGGFEEVEEVWEPAGLVTIQKTLETADGVVRVSELAFPHLDPTTLVCVQRKKKIAAPDRKANEYLVDRVAGRPTQAVEIDADPDGTLEVTADAMTQAASELALWRKQMHEQLSSLSVPPTPPTPATPTA